MVSDVRKTLFVFDDLLDACSVREFGQGVLLMLDVLLDVLFDVLVGCSCRRSVLFDVLFEDLLLFCSGSKTNVLFDVRETVEQ